MNSSINNIYQKVFEPAPDHEALTNMTTLLPFGEVVVDFVDTVSKKLLTLSEIRTFPELAALGFWFRKASIEKLKKHTLDENRIRVPRGIAFHVAPANVDTIFVYSWFLSLLCGNCNIVRISSKPSRQVELILGVIGSLFNEKRFHPVRDRSLIVQYGHDARVNELFSSICDIRLIWGGDQTIREIRKAPLPPTAVEMVFADKYSFAIINVERLLSIDDARLVFLLDAFYNDVYWFSQMACSSPRLIFWYSDNEFAIQKARERFWTLFEKRLEQADTGLDMSDYVNKRVAADSLALNESVRIEHASCNDIVRVWLPKPELHVEYHCGAGLFFESSLSHLEDMLPLLSRKIQTVSYFGIEKEVWTNFLIKNNTQGIDRIVPFGRALDFNYVWDGFDMPGTLLREITLT